MSQQKDPNSEFPKFLVTTTHPGRSKERKYLSMARAGVMFDYGHAQVEISKRVLEEDFSVRDITEAERQQISDIADSHSDSK